METLEKRICHLRLAVEKWMDRLRLLWVRVLTRRILSRFPKAMNIRNWRRRKNLYERAKFLRCGRGGAWGLRMVGVGAKKRCRDLGRWGIVDI